MGRYDGDNAEGRGTTRNELADKVCDILTLCLTV
jgi:hypothetical protein